MEKRAVPEPLRRIQEARHHDPFEVLGCHITGNTALVRVFLPQAEQANLVEADDPPRPGGVVRNG